MQRNPLFLVASAAETARFIALAFLAGALGGLREGEGLPALFRYAAAPQLLFVAAFFFLWLDRERYGAYRALLLVGKVLSLVAFIPLFISMVQNRGSSLMSRTGPTAAMVAVGIDLFSFMVLLLSGTEGAPSDSGGSSHALSSPDSPSVESVQTGLGPRGPEDIEKVEG